MQHLFGKSVHSAFVVPSLDESIARLLGSGYGPAFMLPGLLFKARFRGRAHQMKMNVAFFAVGGTHFEYIEQVDDSESAYTDFLKRHPGGGLHHIAYHSTDFAADLERAKAAGAELEVEEELLAPDGSLFEIYARPKGQHDAVLTQLMYPATDEDDAFCKMEEIAAQWDGRDPVRDLFSLLPKSIDLATT